MIMLEILPLKKIISSLKRKGTTETIKALLPILIILFPMSTYLKKGTSLTMLPKSPMSTYLKRGLSCSVIPLKMFPLSNVTSRSVLPLMSLSTYLKRGSKQKCYPSPFFPSLNRDGQTGFVYQDLVLPSQGMVDDTKRRMLPKR